MGQKYRVQPLDGERKGLPVPLVLVRPLVDAAVHEKAEYPACSITALTNKALP